MRRGVPAPRLPQRLYTRVGRAVLYAPLVAKFALAFACLGLLVSLQAARSAEFCERTVLFTTHTQPSAARRSRNEHRAGLEPLISPSLSAIVAHCPTARAEDTDTTLFEKARVASGRLPLAPAAALTDR